MSVAQVDERPELVQRGDKARLYVNDNPQPVLIVNDVKSGASARGAVVLWIGPGTIGHFRNVTVTPSQ